MKKKQPNLITETLGNPIILNDGDIFEYSIKANLQPKKLIINGKVFNPVKGKDELIPKTFFYDINTEKCIIMV
jgi:hypothetical protein